MAKKWHLYAWEPGEEGESGEMKHFTFQDKPTLIEYLNQMAYEMETMPIMTHEFGLKKKDKMKIGDFVHNEYIFINYGEDMDISLTDDQNRVKDVYSAE